MSSILWLRCSVLSVLVGSLAFGLEDRATPEPIEMKSPAYPPELVLEARKGQAKIEFIIGADGRVHDPKVVAADHPAFGTAAIAALAEWSFKPVVKNGVAIDKKVAMPFVFKPSPIDSLNKALGRIVYQNLPEPGITLKEWGQRPKPVKRSRPQYPESKKGSGEEVTLRMQFVIGPDGKTYNPDTKDEAAQEFKLSAIGAISRMEFEPPKKDGKPVYVKMLFPVKITETPQRGGGGGGRGGPGGGGAGGGGEDN